VLFYYVLQQNMEDRGARTKSTLLRQHALAV